MRPTSPRIAPLPTSEFTDEQAKVIGTGHGDPMNELSLVRTMVQHSELYKRFIPFAAGLVLQTTIPTRDREIITLRTLALTGETYEANAHIEMARLAGLTTAEADAARKGSGLSGFEQTLLDATTELVKGYCLSDATWAALAKIYSKQQIIELHFTVGNYVLMSMVSISLGIQTEEQAIVWKPKA